MNNNTRKYLIMLFQKTFASKCFKGNIADCPRYCFPYSDVDFIIHNRKNMIKTPGGYFRVVFTHLPIYEYIAGLLSYFLFAHKINIPVDSTIYRMLTDSQTIDYLIAVHHLRGGGIPKEITDKYVLSNTEKNLVKTFNDFFNLEMGHYWMHKGQTGMPQTYSANRIMGVQSLFTLLGESSLIPETTFATLKIDDYTLFGTMMKEAKGIYPLRMKESISGSITDTLYRQLTVLNIVDAISNEYDHRPGNYFVEVDRNESKALSISVFDNDCPWTFFPFFKRRFVTYESTSPLVKKGVVNRPCVDSLFVERLLTIDKHQLYSTLMPYLNKLQLCACYYRIKTIQKAIKKTISTNPSFLVKHGDKSIIKEFIEMEAKGEYGKTYTYVFVHWYEICQKKYPSLIDKLK